MTDVDLEALPPEERAMLVAVADEYLLGLEERVVVIVAHLKAEIPEYAAVPAEDVESSTAAIVRSVLVALSGNGFDVGGVQALDELARRRVGQGFPLEALTRSIQLAARDVLAELLLLAQRDRIPSAVLLHAQDIAWRIANGAAALVSTVAREMAEDLARRDVGRRSDFLRGVLLGDVHAARIQAEAPLYGLDPAAVYVPMRARPANPGEEEHLALVIRRTGSTQRHRPVLGVLQGELVALAPQCPAHTGAPALAVAAARPLMSVREAFLETGLALETALAFGRSGLVNLDDLGPLPLALVGERLAPSLEGRHAAALDREGPVGKDLETTVLAWLHHDRRLDDAATALGVHRNTVRYRLGRFRELTGLDARRTDDLVSVWWLLHRRAMRSTPPGT